MPRPSKRTRKRKPVSKALPGGGETIHYKQKVNSPPHCHLCGRPIGGIPHLSTSEKSKLNRSQRTVSRPYGGQVCPKCLKDLLRQVARTL